MRSAGEIRDAVLAIQSDTAEQERIFGQHSNEAASWETELTGQRDRVQRVMGLLVEAASEMDMVYSVARGIANSGDDLQSGVAEGKERLGDIKAAADDLLGSSSDSNAQSARGHLTAAQEAAQEAGPALATAKTRTSDSVDVARAILDGINELRDRAVELEECTDDAAVAINGAKGNLDAVKDNTHEAAEELGEYAVHI
jgi:methyl-accepting chemotaxis protein